MSERETVDQTPLGLCPKCTARIPESDLVIEYERQGRRSVFAHCRNCDNVVRPR